MGVTSLLLKFKANERAPKPPQLVNLSILSLLESKHRRKFSLKRKKKKPNTHLKTIHQRKKKHTVETEPFWYPQPDTKWSCLVLQSELTSVWLKTSLSCPNTFSCSQCNLQLAASSRPDLITTRAQSKSVSVLEKKSCHFKADVCSYHCLLVK